MTANIWNLFSSLSNMLIKCKYVVQTWINEPASSREVCCSSSLSSVVVFIRFLIEASTSASESEEGGGGGEPDILTWSSRTLPLALATAFCLSRR